MAQLAQIGDLTTLSRVKDWLNTSVQAYPAGDDTKLAALISGASRFVRNYLVSPIVPATYVEKRNGTGTGSMFLRNRPVISVSALLIAGVPQDPAINTNGCGWKNDDSQIYVPGTWFPCGLLNVEVTYVAGYQATAAIEIPGSGPNTIDVSTIQGTSLVDGTAVSNWNSDQGIVLADGTVLAKVASNPAIGQYTLTQADDKPWTYGFNASQPSQAATVTFGYTPDDLAEATTELVGERFKTRNRIGQTSMHLGSNQTVSFNQKDFNEFIRTTLNSYKNVVPV